MHVLASVNFSVLLVCVRVHACVQAEHEHVYTSNDCKVKVSCYK